MTTFHGLAIGPDELIVDNFAGGGGASLGIEMALGRSPDIAINHDPEAVAMHRANHPETTHYCESVWKVRPEEACKGRRVGLAWFSPDCTHHSKARGGKPAEKGIRGLAWVVIRWAKTVRPRVIILENVEERESWGPLDAGFRPCPRRKGSTFRRWRTTLQNLGYRVEHRMLRACDYGAPTIRRRLFLVARCDGRPIAWPEPTHGDPRRIAGSLFDGDLIPWRTAAECIDWSIPCPSIFGRKRPLAENTLRRIAAGIRRYVIECPEPFVVSLTHHGGDRVEGIDSPFRTITGANRGEKALAVPFVTKFRQNSVGSGAGEPLHTVTGGGRMRRPAGAAHAMGLVSPTLVQVGYGEREGQAPRALDLGRPLGTAVGSQKHALVVSHLLKLYGSCRDGQPMDQPAPTVRAQGTHLGEVRAFLLKYYGANQDPRLTAPLHTVTSKDRFGLVTVHGEEWAIFDVGLRMLTPRELFRAQGFPDSYAIDPVVGGKPLSKTAQVRMCGNSVAPPIAAAVARAQFEPATSCITA